MPQQQPTQNINDKYEIKVKLHHYRKFFLIIIILYLLSCSIAILIILIMNFKEFNRTTLYPLAMFLTLIITVIGITKIGFYYLITKCTLSEKGIYFHINGYEAFIKNENIKRVVMEVNKNVLDLPDDIFQRYLKLKEFVFFDWKYNEFFLDRWRQYIDLAQKEQANPEFWDDR